MQHLFKLKKAGKTVGYLRLPTDPYLAVLGILYSEDDNNWERCPKHIIDGESFDEALHYVCDDKNGDKVFAGDETNHGIVAWNSEYLTWMLLENVEDMLGDGEKHGIENNLSEWKDDIELIKDEK